MNKNFHEAHKTFLRAYEASKQSHQKLQSFYKDKRIPRFEKKILYALLDFRKGKISEAIDELGSIGSMNPFLEGFRYFLLGLCYNNSCQYLKSLDCHKLSIEMFESIGERDYIFKPISSAIITSFNSRLKDELEFFFNKLVLHPQDSIFKEILFLKAQTLSALMAEDGEKAELLSSQAIEKCKEGDKGSMSFLFVLKIMGIFKQKDLKKCFDALEDYKKSNGMKIKSNYKYMNSMLNFLDSGKKFYVYEKDYREAPLLFHELSVIKHLYEEEQAKAMFHWSELKALNPYLYRDDFSYNGDYTMFSAALNSLLKQNTEERAIIVSPEEIAHLSSNKEKLVYILQKSKGYVTKDEIIMLLWGEEWSPENDSRLRSLVYRIQKKENLNFETSNGRYKLAA